MFRSHVSLPTFLFFKQNPSFQAEVVALVSPASPVFWGVQVGLLILSFTTQFVKCVLSTARSMVSLGGIEAPLVFSQPFANVNYVYPQRGGKHPVSA